MASNGKRAIAELGADARVLIGRLRELSSNEMLTYEDLSQLIGRDVRTVGRGALTTAMNRLMRDERMVFAAVHGEGIKRLDDSGIVRVGVGGIERVHRAARRSLLKMGCADFSKLANAEKITHNATAAALGVLANITTQHKLKKLESKVSEKQEPLALAKTLDAFKE